MPYTFLERVSKGLIGIIKDPALSFLGQKFQIPLDRNCNEHVLSYKNLF